MPTQAPTDMPPSYQLVAGPEPDRAGVHVDKPALEVEADAAELLRLRPGLELLGRHVRQEEVDRVAVRVLAIARDLVALLAEDEVELGMAKARDDVDDVAVKALHSLNNRRHERRIHLRHLDHVVIALEVIVDGGRRGQIDGYPLVRGRGGQGD